MKMISWKKNYLRVEFIKKIKGESIIFISITYKISSNELYAQYIKYDL